MIKPIIKWVGGKTHIKDTVLSYFPKNIDTYYEPFIGGGSVLFELLNRLESGDISINRLIIGDKNKTLIDLYNTVKTNPEELIIELGNLFPKKDISLADHKNYYYSKRNEYNNDKISVLRKVSLFIYLNKTCFRGLYRIGPNGFNVPFGHYKTFNIDIENIRNVSILLNKYNVISKNIEFDKIIDTYNKNKDFIYLDPPYYPIDNKSFTSYNLGGFNENDFSRLFKFCQNHKRFIQSNSNTEYNKNKYGSTFDIIEIKCRHSINSKDPSKEVTEILIIGKFNTI